MPKHPKAKFKPSDKNIRKRGDPEDYIKFKPSWAVGRIDRYHRWGWENIPKNEIWRDIYSKLKNFESMTWATITRNGSHNIEIEKLIPDAKKRLEELNLNDLEELFSLRLTGIKRIYGILEMGVLSILWYDPDHEICPSEKKNT